MSNESFQNRNQIEIFEDPEFLAAFGPLVMHCFNPKELNPILIYEAFFLLSTSAGCRHCQAHGGYSLHLAGIDDDRIQALWTFEQSDKFTEAEKAVYRFSLAAGKAPSDVTPEHHADLRKHYSDTQIGELLKIVGVSGFLNRYNDAVAVVTDEESFVWAEKVLSPAGWEGNRHRGDSEEQRKWFPREIVENSTSGSQGK